MRVVTHLAFTFVCFLFYLDYIDVHNPVLFAAIALFMTLFVDIDEPESTIGKRFWLFAKVTNFIFGHRGLLHSLLVPILFFCIFIFFQQQEIAYAVVLGYISHLVMDMITPAGIFPLYPLKWRIHGPIKGCSFVEYVMAFTLLAIIIFKLLFA